MNNYRTKVTQFIKLSGGKQFESGEEKCSTHNREHI
ncbi:hypothetical protein COCOBI_pt-1800 (chloroplast) [Coccomyxa sp. Obi]|nr:hypothetical protein COCOBI_pt-1800 [Coccomyxa sp. Obi]